MNPYTVNYRAEPRNDEHGWSYQVFCRSRLVFEGWARGRKHNAEAEVREGINARETLRDCAGLS